MRFLITLTISCFICVSQVLAEDSLSLARKKGCLGCHNIDRAEVGPAWKEVADKYKSKENATNELVASIMYGSMGKWGERPMRGNAKRVSRDDATTLATFILNLEQ